MNIRTVVLSVVFVAIITLTAGLVAAETKNNFDKSSEPANPVGQEPSFNLNEPNSATSYRSQHGECFDVPIRELAACRDASPVSVQADRAPIDECFDVSLWEVANCRKANQTSVP